MLCNHLSYSLLQRPPLVITLAFVYIGLKARVRRSLVYAHMHARTHNCCRLWVKQRKQERKQLWCPLNPSNGYFLFSWREETVMPLHVFIVCRSVIRQLDQTICPKWVECVNTTPSVYACLLDLLARLSSCIAGASLLSQSKKEKEEHIRVPASFNLKSYNMISCYQLQSQRLMMVPSLTCANGFSLKEVKGRKS